MDKYGIVILNYNTFEDTQKCIESIYKNISNLEQFNIYIVDNFSPDGSGEKIKEKYDKLDNIHVIISEKNLGFSGGNNLGIKKAKEDKCKYIFLLNSDIIILNDAFKYMINVFEKDDDIAAVGPYIINRKNEYAQFARKGLNLKSYILSKGVLEKIFKNRLKRIRVLNYNINENFKFKGMVSGCCFALRTTFIIENHCLDDNVFMYYEEDILAHLIEKSNNYSEISCKAKVKHNEGISTEKTSKNKLLFTRLYRWTSSLYVLKNYAHVPKIICNLIGTSNIIIWKIFAIWNAEYRNNFEKFKNEIKRVNR